ncbi:hypothetical protein [Mucilaginibacter sp. CSA2-8R]|uniref:hypothetical protein n=1 Tax=Mucilaginibacter sp. CSA2-8R TaxID=3141542 RepID=UPI00315C64E0
MNFTYPFVYSFTPQQHCFYINPKIENEARLRAIFPQMKGKLIIPTFGRPIVTPDTRLQAKP